MTLLNPMFSFFLTVSNFMSIDPFFPPPYCCSYFLLVESYYLLVTVAFILEAMCTTSWMVATTVSLRQDFPFPGSSREFSFAAALGEKVGGKL